jgi:hypothetical protein
MKNSETIVAAAIRVKVPEPFASERWKGKPVYPVHLTITAPPPARHAHLLHPVMSEEAIGPDDQGFVTSRGRYVDRYEALRIVIAAGQTQIDHPSRNAGGQLFSEDLW